MNKNMKNKGITLITLAITIVVLIILAGVSINAVIGDDGIIKKAQDSADLTKESEAKEIINRAILEFYLPNEYETLEDFFNAKVSVGKIDKVEKNVDGTLKVWKNGYSVTVENKLNSSNGSSSGGSTGGETQIPEITVGKIKIVADSAATGSAITEAASVYLGNTLYITFSHSINGGTTIVDKEIPYAITKNGTYTFTVTGTVNGKSYTKNISVTVNQFKNVYELAQENKKITYPDGTIWLPEGFGISNESAETIQNGVVIEDKDGNQFVWIPVASISNYTRRYYVGDNSFSGYSETLPNDEKTSITTYKGFYMGRFEAGDKESTIQKKYRESNSSTSNTITIARGQVPYNHITRNQAISLAENFDTKQGYKAFTKIVSSYAWDTTMEFLKKVNSDYTSNSEEGNYTATTFSYTDITGERKIKESGVSVLVPTGQTTPVCNIYDMGGNVDEWSTENSSEKDYPCVIRGGDYGDISNTTHPAGTRIGIYDGNFASVFGFRLTLFL